MQRLLTLVFVLAHLGAMAVPCVETSPNGEAPIRVAASMAMAMAQPMQTPSNGDEARDSAERGGPGGSRLEMSAPCVCGCCKTSGSRSTVTPVAQTLASRPAESPPLATTPLPVEERDVAPWPASPVEPPEHVPIPS